MSIVKKLMTIASDMQRVYRVGYDDGAKNGSIKPSGYVTITENGTYDVTPYAQALVVVPDSGGLDAFWEVYQNGGNRTNYTNAFNGDGWKDEIFTPKYLIKPIGEVTGMFNRCRLTVVDDTKVDFSEATIFQTVFMNSQTIKKVVINASSATIMNQTFRGAYNLEEVNIGLLGENCTFNSVFQSCNNIKSLKIMGTIGQNGFNVSPCTKLSEYDILNSIIYNLADKTADTSGKNWVCTLGTTNLAKLTDAEKAVATQKGWTLA